MMTSDVYLIKYSENQLQRVNPINCVVSATFDLCMLGAVNLKGHALKGKMVYDDRLEIGKYRTRHFDL